MIFLNTIHVVQFFNAGERSAITVVQRWGGTGQLWIVHFVGDLAWSSTKKYIKNCVDGYVGERGA